MGNPLWPCMPREIFAPPRNLTTQKTPDLVQPILSHDGLTCGLSILRLVNAAAANPRPNPVGGWIALWAIRHSDVCLAKIFAPEPNPRREQTPDLVQPIISHDGLTCGLSILRLNYASAANPRPNPVGGWIAPLGQSVMAMYVLRKYSRPSPIPGAIKRLIWRNQ